MNYNRVLNTSGNNVPLMRGERPPIERAEDHATQFGRAASRLHRKIRGAVEDLFGHVVAEALLPGVEDVTENASEAIHHFRDAVDDQQRRAQVAEMKEHRAIAALVDASVAIQARFRGATGDSVLPDDLRAVVLEAADLVGWSPWLWPPADYRHTHEIDGRGECRNPACHYKTAPTEEPF